MTDTTETAAQLPLDGVGTRLRRAREAAGLTRTQIAAATRIPERHLAAIEDGDFAALPARAYAVGFSRSYAKVVGLNSKEITEALQDELAGLEPGERRGIPAFEPGDPNRVPGSRLAWLSALAAVVLILAGFVWWSSYYLPGGELPSLLPPEQTAPTTPAPDPSETATSAAVQSGPVVFTALEDRVWVKFNDGSGKQLLQKELALGESFTIPAEMEGVKLWTGRPDALAITIGGQSVPKLSEVQRTMKDIPVSAAALLARGATPPAITPSSPAPIASAAPARPRTSPVQAPVPSASTPAQIAAPTAGVPAVATAPSPTAER